MSTILIRAALFVAMLVWSAPWLCAQASPSASVPVKLSDNVALQELSQKLVRDLGKAIPAADGTIDLSATLPSFELEFLRITTDGQAATPACTDAQTCTAVAAVATTSQTQVQNGASASSTASTSAAQKVGIPTLLGLAVESGAITNNVSGNTMTLSTTLYAITSAFTGDTARSYKNCAHCSQLGGSASFNLTSTDNTLQQASRRQIAQWQIKYTFRDTTERSSAAIAMYGEVKKAAQQVANEASKRVMYPYYRDLTTALAGVDLTSALTANRPLLKISRDVNALRADLSKPATLTDAKVQDLAIDLLKYIEASTEVQDILSRAREDQFPLYRSAVKNYLQSNQSYLKQISDLSKGWNGAVTFGQQYPTTTITLPTGTITAPTYLAGGLILTYQPTATVPIRPSVTFNGGATFYPKPVVAANEQTFRGGTAALQMQWSLGKGPFITDPLDNSQVTLSLNGNYSRLQENQHQANKKADIALGNLKLEIPLSGGASLPLSVTIANSSEQVSESYVRGNFGISFDLDKLLALRKAKN